MKVPQHIAVIMDGNGRWATSRGLSRSAGHKEGTANLERLLDHLLLRRIPVVSLYAFSTENWRRPRTEIHAIFSLVEEFITTHLNKMVGEGVRMVVSGDLSRIPKRSRELLLDAIEKTRKGIRLTANFCLNYGSRSELLRAAQEYALWYSSHKTQRPPTEKQFQKFFWQPNLPDIDMLVRTAGELRLSNFMLWQAAYAELYFTEKTWPEFGAEDLDEAIREFHRRKRKFGGL